MKIDLSIPDDSGFAGIVNADRYQSFVGEDWEFDQIRDRIIQEARKGHILFWGTGCENTWPITVCDVPAAEQEHRCFSGKMIVSNGLLNLINFEAITMAAQFEDETLPPAWLADGKIALENGVYEVTVRQLYDPNVLAYDEEPLGFELVLRRTSADSTEVHNDFAEIPWSLQQ